jgi:hypothetical protein
MRYEAAPMLRRQRRALARVMPYILTALAAAVLTGAVFHTNKRSHTMKKAALLALLTALSIQTWGQDIPVTLYVRGGLHYYAFPSDPVDKSYPGFRLGGGVELPLAVLFKQAPGYLSGGIETGFNHFSVVPSGEALSFVPVSLALMYYYPFETFLNGRFTLGAGLLAGGTAAIAQEGDFLFFIGPRLEGSYRLWAGKFPGSLYLGLGVDSIAQRKPTVVFPAIELGLRLRFPLRRAAKTEINIERKDIEE